MSLTWEHPSDKAERHFDPIAPTVVEFDYAPTEPVGTLLAANGDTLSTVYPARPHRVPCGFALTSPTEENPQ